MKNIFKKLVLGLAINAALMAAGTTVSAEDFYYKKAVTVQAPEITDDPYLARDSRTGFWVVGGGAMVEKFPLSASKYTLPIAFFAYENIHKKALGNFDFAWALGFYDLMPEVEFAAVLPMKPFDIRFSAGAYYDMIIGGHAGMLVKAGAIINKTIGLDIMLVPIGTQPTVSYSESLKNRKITENDGSQGLDFPIVGVLFSTRF